MIDIANSILQYSHQFNIIDAGLTAKINKIFFVGRVNVTKMWQVDEKALSKKYRTNVGRLIRAWKHGITDQEITVKTGIAPVTLHLIKQDIELTHRHIRLAQKKLKLAKDQSASLRPDFF